MSVEDQLTLAQLDYEMHGGGWPLERAATEQYIAIVHPTRTVDRHLLVDILGEFIGTFDSLAELARAVTAQSYLGDSDIDLSGWPFIHIDWAAAAVTLEGSIAHDQPGPIVRVRGRHFFAPGTGSSSEHGT